MGNFLVKPDFAYGMDESRKAQKVWLSDKRCVALVTGGESFSYNLTSHYSVPHGAAVYMMFPYICRANGHPEFIRKSARLKTLREFVEAKGLNYDILINNLFENVNPARLGNNPCEVKKEHLKN